MGTFGVFLDTSTYQPHDTRSEVQKDTHAAAMQWHGIALYELTL